MPGPETPGALVWLSIKALDTATEIFVIDSKFQLVPGGRGHGSLHLSVPPGIYKLKFRLGTTLHESLQEVPAGVDEIQVAAPALRIATPAPLGRSSSVQLEHIDAAYTHSRQIHVQRGVGSQLFVFTHGAEHRRRHPASGLSLCDIGGRELVSFSEEGEFESEGDWQWSACNVTLAPGPYLLRLSTRRGVLEQVVMASPKWQTQVFLGPPPFEEGPDAHLDVANAAILVSPPGFNPDESAHLLAEVARQCLTEGRRVPFTERLSQVAWAPMLSLYRAYSRLLAPPESEDDHLGHPLTWRLQQDLGAHPDVQLLALVLDGESTSFHVPPMLQLGWSRLVKETLARPEIIPAGSLAAQASTSLWGSGTWLVWSREQPVMDRRVPPEGDLPLREGELTPLEAAAQSLVPRHKPRPSRLPRWVEESDPFLHVSSTTVARSLRLPVSVAEETVAALRARRERARQARAVQRQRLLAEPGVALCRVLIPTGVRPDPTGGPAIDFDRVYEEAIEPAVLEMGMVPIRVAPELVTLHPHNSIVWWPEGPSVLELSTRSPTVAYALGAEWPFENILVLCARHHRAPAFDTWRSRLIEYDLGKANRFDEPDADALRSALMERLLQQPRFQDSTHAGARQLREHLLRTDILREQLAEARARDDRGEGLRRFERDLTLLEGVDKGLLIDLFLSYRPLKAWEDMIRVADAMPEELKRLVVVREQLAFALNRREKGKKLSEGRARARDLLETLVEEYGPNPETNGLLGRIYEDLWEEFLDKQPEKASWFLDRAIASYIQGFESDWRDYYPGIKAITLLEVRGDPGSLLKREQLLPVVRFAVEQRLQGTQPDYWDHATMLELAVLEGKRDLAHRHLLFALALIREKFESETTARNLRLIKAARRKRKRSTSWLEALIRPLKQRAQ